jgi:hypothetical protein
VNIGQSIGAEILSFSDNSANSGPCAMRAKPSQASNAQTGQVSSWAQRADIEPRQHGAQILWQDRFLLRRRTRIGAPDAGEHDCNMAIAAVEREAALPAAQAAI